MLHVFGQRWSHAANIPLVSDVKSNNSLTFFYLINSTITYLSDILFLLIQNRGHCFCVISWPKFFKCLTERNWILPMLVWPLCRALSENPGTVGLTAALEALVGNSLYCVVWLRYRSSVLEGGDLFTMAYCLDEHFHSVWTGPSGVCANSSKHMLVHMGAITSLLCDGYT